MLRPTTDTEHRAPRRAVGKCDLGVLWPITVAERHVRQVIAHSRGAPADRGRCTAHAGWCSKMAGGARSHTWHDTGAGDRPVSSTGAGHTRHPGLEMAEVNVHVIAPLPVRTSVTSPRTRGMTTCGPNTHSEQRQVGAWCRHSASVTPHRFCAAPVSGAQRRNAMAGGDAASVSRSSVPTCGFPRGRSLTWCGPGLGGFGSVPRRRLWRHTPPGQTRT